MYHLHTVCRACHYGETNSPSGIKATESLEKLIPVLDLGIQPLANDFRTAKEEQSGHAPLKVLYCPQCSLAQLSVVVKPEILYRHYSYVTSPSSTMRSHFNSLTNDILTEMSPGSVIEIGSNDGLFLAHLNDRGFGNLVGIDPARNLAEQASKIGILTINDFIGMESAKQAREASGKTNLIIARHVFCHLNDWHGFIKSLDVMADRDTLIAIEVPYAVDQITNNSWDQIYHEHLSYLTIKSMKWLLSETPFHLHRICHYDIHGGTILVMLRRNDSAVPPHPSVDKYLLDENVTLDSWKKLAEEAEMKTIQLRDMVQDMVDHGKRVCGYGASAKSTVWVNACGFTRRHLQFICDSTREKVYCNSPGSEIPIVHEGMHVQDCIDYAVMFCWNYKDELIARERQFAKLGGKWIIPVPKIEIA